MKKKPLICCAIFILFISNISLAFGETGELSSGYALEKSPNLAPNPSFEQGDTMPAGWAPAPQGNGTYTWNSDYAYVGEKSIGVLNLTNNSESSEIMWVTTDYIPVDCTNYSYRWVVWYKFVEIPPECHFVMVRFLIYDSNHQFLGTYGAGISPPNDTDWHQFGCSTNYGDTKYVKLEMGQWWDLDGEPDPSIELRFDDVNFSVWNTVPDKPTITGETEGRVRTSYEYTISACDPDQDDVTYEIDWGDNTTEFTDPYVSGEEIRVNHTWIAKGTYTIRVRAIDEHWAASNWATLPVHMPSSYNIPSQGFWGRFLERFPHAFPILRYFLRIF